MIFPKTNDPEQLRKHARQIRKDIVEMIGIGSRGHFGGSLSCADIVAVLYYHAMNHDPADPQWQDRDRFILSKGHAAPVQYAALAGCGYFGREKFASFKRPDGMLQGHPDMLNTPGIEANTGSLGQGLSLGIGMALGLKKDRKDSRVYVIMGDGELGEGQIWEAATVASHYKLENLTAIIDNNRIQAMGFTADRVFQGDHAMKWSSFGWEAFRIDGHSIESIITAIDAVKRVKGKPSVIIADTIKGKGISFTENTSNYHNNEMNSAQYGQALMEIENSKA